jgi:hypothetical protein
MSLTGWDVNWYPLEDFLGRQFQDEGLLLTFQRGPEGREAFLEI